jgi:biopolymer transport protein TolR
VTDHVDSALRDNSRVQKERELYIRADKAARYGIVATVVAAARASGVESLNLLVEPVVEELGPEPVEAKSTPKAPRQKPRSRTESVP